MVLISKWDRILLCACVCVRACVRACVCVCLGSVKTGGIECKRSFLVLSSPGSASSRQTDRFSVAGGGLH